MFFCIEDKKALSPQDKLTQQVWNIMELKQKTAKVMRGGRERGRGGGREGGGERERESE